MEQNKQFAPMDYGSDNDPLLAGSDGVTVAQCSQYNFGPRRATDKVFGFLFVGVLIAFFGWSGYGINQASSACGSTQVLVWNYNQNDWYFNASTGSCARYSCEGVAPVTTPAPAPTPGVHFACEKTVGELIAIPLVVAVIGGVILGVLMIVGFKYKPYFMVYLSCGIQILAPAGLGIYLIVESHNINAQTDAGTENADGSQAFTYPAYFLFAVSGVLALLYYWARASIKLCAELFQFAAVGIEENFCLIPLQTSFAIVAMVVKCCMLAMIVTSICVMEVAVPVAPINNVDDYIHDDQIHDDFIPNERECELQLGSQWHAYLGYSCFALGWFAFWALETRNYITADVIGHWYWHGKDGSSITRGIKHVFCSHFGTVAFAGLCVWFVEWLKKQARTRPSHPIACLCVMIARCILSYIEYLFKMAVIVVAITGRDFVSSGKQVGVLFWSSFNTMSHSTGVWYFPPRILSVFSVLLSAIWGTLYGVSAYHPVKKDCLDGKLCMDNLDTSCHDVALYYSIVIGIVVWLVVWFLLAFFSSILLCIVDTAFMCFVMDKQAGVVTKPQFHAIFNTVLDYKRKTMRKRSGPAEKPPAYVLEAAPQYSVQRAQPQPYPPQPQGAVPPPTYTNPMTANMTFDPMTGQQLSSAPSTVHAPMRFDPITGAPLSSDSHA
eukprot:m.112691 g.112691  ORF g.112691 m.112691 type:complete len:665 (-) comp17034_c0_seq1:299-2293(-)